MTAEERGFLESQRVARLATVDRQGRPHVVPVCFACLGDTIYTPIDEKPKRTDALALRRVRNILACSAVCLLVDRYDEDWRSLAWLQVRGDAELVNKADERQAALEALRARYAQYRTMTLDDAPLIAIRAKRVVAWRAMGAA